MYTFDTNFKIDREKELLEGEVVVKQGEEIVLKVYCTIDPCKATTTRTYPVTINNLTPEEFGKIWNEVKEGARAAYSAAFDN